MLLHIDNSFWVPIKQNIFLESSLSISGEGRYIVIEGEKDLAPNGNGAVEFETEAVYDDKGKILHIFIMWYYVTVCFNGESLIPYIKMNSW